MNVMTPVSYPGDEASSSELFTLAAAYHVAAEALFEDKSHIMPARLLALQAVEGYLITYSRHAGRTNAEVRSAWHDYIKLADIGADTGLALRHRVHLHLARMVKNREYLTVRYGAEVSGPFSQITELRATLNELKQKVGAALGVKP